MKRFPDMESWDDDEEDRLEHVTMYGQTAAVRWCWILTDCAASRDVERGLQRRKSLRKVSRGHVEGHLKYENMN